MVNITPIEIWKSGTVLSCNILTVQIKDNCKDRSDVFFGIGTKIVKDGNESMVIHQTGGLVILGIEYDEWTNNPNTNAWIYNWTATKLNISIL